MAHKKSPKLVAPDLSAVLGQSAVNKLLNAIKFPFTLFEQNTPPPKSLSGGEVADNEVALEKEKVQKLLKSIAQSAKTYNKKKPVDFTAEERFYSEALGNISEVIQSAKDCLKVMDGPQTQTTAGQVFSYPDREYLQKIVDGGIENLLDTAKGLELKAICSHLEVAANNKPDVTLNGAVVSIANSKITVKATGELWAHIPTFHCSRWCTRWTISWKWERLASISISIIIAMDGYVKIVINGKVVNAQLHFNSLRLDYLILREIPLEVIANKVLQNKLIPVFNAADFVACVPVINSRFAIDSIAIPNTNGNIEIDINVKQL